jgi:hypothetical protein
LGCAKQEGILEGLADGSRSAEEVAKELRVSPRAAHALLSALAEMGVVAEDGDRFRLLGEHRGPLLDRSHPDYAGGLVVQPVRADPEVGQDARDTEDGLSHRG